MEPCGARNRSDGYFTNGGVAARIADDRLDRPGAPGPSAASRLAGGLLGRLASRHSLDPLALNCSTVDQVRPAEQARSRTSCPIVRRDRTYFTLDLTVHRQSRYTDFRVLRRQGAAKHKPARRQAAKSYCSYHGEDAKVDQRPILNLSVRTPDGSIRHGYATELMFPPRDLGQDPGDVDAVWPMGARSISRPRAAARARIRS
jgi:hypothetical protein